MPDAPKKLRRGLIYCPACGVVVSETRKTPHPETPECIIVRVATRMRARDYTRAGSSAGVVERAGLPLERAPVAVRTTLYETHPDDPKRLRHVPWDIPEEGVFDGPWTTRRALDAVHAWQGARMQPEERTTLVLRVYHDEELLLAVKTAKRLGDVAALQAWVDDLRATRRIGQ